MVRRTLAAAGLRESWTGSLGSPSDLDALRLPPDHPARKMVRLANPMSAEESALRTTLLPGLLRSAAHNLAHRASEVALFEVARVYEPSGDKLPHEPLVLGAVTSGRRTSLHWREGAVMWDFFGAKGVLEALFDGLGLDFPVFAPAEGMPFHPTRGATIALEGTRLGVLGELHPDVCADWDLTEGTVAFELALGPLIAAVPARVRAPDLPRFPGTFIDVAVVVDESVPAQRIEALIRTAGEPEVVSVRLFDLYRGEQVDAGKKSLAYALELRSPERTLTDEDAVAVRDRIIEALGSVHGTLRT
jgi:phenylalanyl-tRNA synthetase beta chain